MLILRALKLNYRTQKFAENRLPIYKEMGMAGHSGVDWAAYPGSPLYWDVDTKGIVYNLEVDDKGGIGLDIISKDTDGQEYKHRYWHLKGYACKVGDVVETGDLIAYADNTGYSTGSHLHRGLKPVAKDNNGRYYNIYQNNRYWGAISMDEFFINVFVLDYLDNLNGQISILRKIVYLYQLLINKIK